MKQGIHPKYYPQAKVVCACGHTFNTGATVPEMRVDICSQCHPFFTGEMKLIDTMGKVDKFRRRVKLAAKLTKTTKKKRQKKQVLSSYKEAVAKLKEQVSKA
ncbi:MAG: 50S ribosomal protein L31 [bacterium]|nr:50S ribosomal protein L31 [bacterium]